MIYEMRNKWGIAPNKLSVGPICAIAALHLLSVSSCFARFYNVYPSCFARLHNVYLLDDHVLGCILGCEACGRMIDPKILCPVRLRSTTLSSPRVHQDSN
jgi:hypothetical protein